MSEGDRPEEAGVEWGGGPEGSGSGLLDHLDGTGRLDREVIYDGRVVKLSLDSVRFPGGSEGTLELVSHPGASAVLPFLDPPTDPDPRIVLLRQYRYAAGAVLYEIPAGVADAPDEPWTQCAERELEEETGLRAGDLRYLTKIYTTPGFTDEEIHLFAATGLESGRVGRDEDEFLEVVRMPFSRAIAGVREGRIVDGKSVVALLFAASFLTEVWSENRRSPER